LHTYLERRRLKKIVYFESADPWKRRERDGKEEEEPKIDVRGL
jgi:spore maturation protein CgeB